MIQRIKSLLEKARGNALAITGATGITLGAFLLAGCSSYEPLVDLKASENAINAQEDLMECEWLIERYADNWFRYAPDEAMVRRCMIGRGHSVIN